MTSVSVKPDWTVLYDVVGVIDYKPLKHAVNFLISWCWQRRISCLTKLSRLTPTRTTRGVAGVEAVVRMVNCIALRDLCCVGERNGDVAYHTALFKYKYDSKRDTIQSNKNAISQA